MLSSREAWRTILAHAPRDEWLRVRDVYDLVEAQVKLDESDRVPVSNGKSAKWHRTVRNALQGAKKRGEIEWLRGSGFRIPGLGREAALPAI